MTSMCLLLTCGTAQMIDFSSIEHCD
uniref:Uncharacterized protein n=1 Tax=Rhizophora mucronata TaxID=61149 RepID=A0A2P2Q4P3_RHIMU